MTATSSRFEGILLIDKPAGVTSHDVVDRVRRILKMRRIGHAGTLDPLATGLLIILVGKATKASQFLISLDKTYSGTFKLGEATDTHDADGKIVQTEPVSSDLTQVRLQSYFQEFIGDQYQTSPMFSAKKLHGQPLYKLARQGKTVEREPRFIRVSALTLLTFSLPQASFQLVCSKGTYVRTLVHDLGQKIGCGAHLTALRRLHIDRFDLANAVTLKALEGIGPEDITHQLIPVCQAVPSSAY